MKKISIIVPCYNQGEYLAAAVKSIIDQTYANWECILIDDGSTDDTANIAAKLCKTDDRIKYFYKKNGGLSSARNEGLIKAQGDYIQFLDADDLIEEKKLQVSVDSITKNPLLNIVICNFVLCNFDNTIRLPPYCNLSAIDFNFDSILLHWDETFTIPIHCGFFSATLFKEYRFKEDIGAKEDWLMWLHIFSDSPNAAFVDSPLAIYRENPKSMSYNRSHMYENTSRAFTYVMDNVLEEKYKRPFFARVNQFWREEAELLQTKIKEYETNYKDIINSPTFKAGEILLSPFKILRSLIKQSSDTLRKPDTY